MTQKNIRKQDCDIILYTIRLAKISYSKYIHEFTFDKMQYRFLAECYSDAEPTTIRIYAGSRQILMHKLNSMDYVLDFTYLVDKNMLTSFLSWFATTKYA